MQIRHDEEIFDLKMKIADFWMIAAKCFPRNRSRQ